MKLSSSVTVPTAAPSVTTATCSPHKPAARACASSCHPSRRAANESFRLAQSGMSATWPAYKTQSNGQSCGDNGLACANGLCMSIDATVLKSFQANGRTGGPAPCHTPPWRPVALARTPPPPQLPPGACVGLGEPSYPLSPTAPIYLEQQSWHGRCWEWGAGPGPNELGQ